MTSYELKMKRYDQRQFFYLCLIVTIGTLIDGWFLYQWIAR